MRERPYHALFLCTQNSARSILAESIMNKLGKDKCKGFSAGSQPSGEIHPYALDLLSNLGHDVTGLRCKSWEEFARPGAPALDFVFTVCDKAAREVCPVWPGQPVTAQRSMPDPSLAEGSESERRLAFANTVRMLGQRISIFLALPFKSLDRLALENRLAAIGRSNTD
jgi:protein-tyrosine-phosphatase